MEATLKFIPPKTLAERYISGEIMQNWVRIQLINMSCLGEFMEVWLCALVGRNE
jgi:hypothetical protein